MSTTFLRGPLTWTETSNKFTTPKQENLQAASLLDRTECARTKSHRLLLVVVAVGMRAAAVAVIHEAGGGHPIGLYQERI